MAASIRLLVRDPRVVVNTTNISKNVIKLGGRPRWTACRSACRRFGDNRNMTTHFGFQSVPEAEKAQRVYEVFESVAQKYDVMNDVMSLGVHRLWKDTLLRVMSPRPGQRLLDVAGGTGDIAFRFLDYVSSRPEQTDPSRQRDISSKYYYCASEERAGGGLASGQEPSSRAVVCDINKEMLKVGKRKAASLGLAATGLSWVVGDAEELPFDDDQFDVYTVAFGIRNVTHVDRALREALRVLKPGGRFMCLEFGKVTNPLLARLYDAYSFQMIPVLGEVIAGDWKSYQYLVESIRRFPDQETFKCMVEDAGFSRVQYRNLTGGVVALHSGFKL